ncbi:MAG: hypothetical protein Q7R35_08420 [Elusimicrobiota bacterium]|nr:hypothetical protein [Elusimicrobiota bacterium]
MKSQKNKTVSVSVSLKDYNLDTIRYAAYASSGAAHVFIRLDGPGAAVADFTPAGAATGKAIAAAFRAELADEKLREAVTDNNRELREFLVMKALAPGKKPEPASDSCLTAEQEKELEDLIAQVESEIKKDARSGRQRDPLGITKTWEDKYAGKKTRRK